MGVRLVEVRPNLTGSFHDFARSVESQLPQAENVEQLTDLTISLREFTKQHDLSSSQRDELNEIRRRIYAQKRQLAAKAEHIEVEQVQVRQNKSSKELKLKTQMTPPVRVIETRKEATFIIGVQNYLSKIDGEEFIQILLKKIPLLIGSILAGSLLFLQSIELYRSSGFKNHELVAFGGLVMLLGFAALYATRGGILALLCCLYMTGYETYFIASGTVSDELVTKTEAVSHDETLEWHKKQVAHTLADYERHKARYDNPDDKIYQNAWYKKDAVEPAWDKYNSANAKLETYKNQLKDTLIFDHSGWLKILYRLGLVILSMMLVHQLFRRNEKSAIASNLS